MARCGTAGSARDGFLGAPREARRSKGRQIPGPHHHTALAVEDPGRSLLPAQRVGQGQPSRGQLLQDLPDDLAVATQDGSPQRWIADQHQQLVSGGLDREVVGQLDPQTMSRSERGDGLLAADGRAGQDAADRITGQAGQQTTSLALAGHRQRPVVIRSGPVMLVAGVRMTDEIGHRGPSGGARWGVADDPASQKTIGYSAWAGPARSRTPDTPHPWTVTACQGLANGAAAAAADGHHLGQVGVVSMAGRSRPG